MEEGRRGVLVIDDDEFTVFVGARADSLDLKLIGTS
jgi:hypothetical protein